MRFYWIVWGIIISILFAVFAQKAYPEEIYCPNCKELLYKYEGNLPLDGRIDRKDLKPVKGQITPRFRTIRCHRCNAPINGYKFWFWERERPLPKMPYEVYTFMVKDSKGNFVWRPFEVNLED